MNMQETLFNEVDQISEDRFFTDAEKHYEEMLTLCNENYSFYEKYDKLFEVKHKKFEQKMQKIRDAMKKNKDNFERFQKAYESGNILQHTDKFKYLATDNIYPLPSDLILPSWFGAYKVEELAKHRDYLNGFALRIYRNRVTETVRFERKELEEKINHKLDEIAQKYTQSNKLSPPVREITEVQNMLEELQSYDRIIHEISYLIMRKIVDAIKAIAQSVHDFNLKTQEHLKNLY